jgi:hypothetical protein
MVIASIDRSRLDSLPFDDPSFASFKQHVRDIATGR